MSLDVRFFSYICGFLFFGLEIRHVERGIKLFVCGCCDVNLTGIELTLDKDLGIRYVKCCECREVYVFIDEPGKFLLRVEC